MALKVLTEMDALFRGKLIKNKKILQRKLTELRQLEVRRLFSLKTENLLHTVACALFVWLLNVN